MKYLTLACYNAWYDREDEDTLQAAFGRYTRHLEEMVGILPPHVLELAKLRGVDDGLVVRVDHDRSRQFLTLILRCGYIQMGYYDLVLTYEGASVSPTDEWTLAQVARSTKGHRTFVSDLWDHELDRSEEGQIEHRLLFHPGIWFAIRCQDLRWERIGRPNQRLPQLRDRFPGGPLTPPD